MVKSSPSRQRRRACKTNKEMSDEAADAATLTYLLTSSRPPTPRPGPAAPPPPHPTTTTPGRERARARRGQGAERDTPARGHGSAQGDRQAPIGTGHRQRHNVGAGNHPRARKGREQGPGHREEGHQGGHQDPHARKAFQDRGTSAPHPQRMPHDPRGRTPPTCRRGANRTPYRSHWHTPTSDRIPEREGRAHLHGENELHPQRKPQGTPPRSPPP